MLRFITIALALTALAIANEESWTESADTPARDWVQYPAESTGAVLIEAEDAHVHDPDWSVNNHEKAFELWRKSFAPDLAEEEVEITAHQHRETCKRAQLNQQRAKLIQSTEKHTCHNSQAGKSAARFQRENNGFKAGHGGEDSCGNKITQRVQVCAKGMEHSDETDNSKNCRKVSHDQSKADQKLFEDKQIELIQMKASQYTGSATCSKSWHMNGEVRNQGSCGQCWTFSTTEQMRHAMIEQGHGDPGKLSTQFLTNCMRKTSCSGGVDGCCGGDPASAVRWIRQQGGIPTQETYGNVFDSNTMLPEFMQHRRRLQQTGPVSHSGRGITYAGNNPTHSYNCKTVAKAVVSTTDPERMTSETQMADHICNSGSLMIAVDASQWQTYNGGVLQASSCGTSLDHAVLLVGLSQEHNAWIVRNSWGEGWGVSPTDPNQAGTKDQYSNCPQLVQQYGCSANLNGGQTTGQVCQKSCPPAGGSVSAGYIWMQYGGNTCGMTQSAWTAGTVTSVGSGGSSPSPPPPSSGGSSPSPAPPAPSSGCEDTSAVCSRVSSYCHYAHEGYNVRLPGSGTINEDCKKTCNLC